MGGRRSWAAAEEAPGLRWAGSVAIQEALRRPIDRGALTGSEEVEQQAARNGDRQSRLRSCSTGLEVEPNKQLRHRFNPVIDDPLKKRRGIRASDEGNGGGDAGVAHVSLDV